MYQVRPNKVVAHATFAQKGFCRHYAKLSLGKLATVPSTGYTGADMAKAYQFPILSASAPRPTAFIPEGGVGQGHGAKGEQEMGSFACRV